jgi:hypothetical protein
LNQTTQNLNLSQSSAPQVLHIASHLPYSGLNSPEYSPSFTVPQNFDHYSSINHQNANTQILQISDQLPFSGTFSPEFPPKLDLDFPAQPQNLNNPISNSNNVQNVNHSVLPSANNSCLSGCGSLPSGNAV